MSDRTCATCKAGYFDNPVTGMNGECRLHPHPVPIKPQYWCLDWQSKAKAEKAERAPGEAIRRGTTYPKDFEPNDRAKAMAEGFGLNLSATLAEFRDNAEMHGKVWKDWQAAFRNWLRKGVKFQEKRR